MSHVLRLMVGFVCLTPALVACGPGLDAHNEPVEPPGGPTTGEPLQETTEATPSPQASGSCEHGFDDAGPGIPDCDGLCAPAAWLGDGYCDDGAQSQVDFTCRSEEQPDCSAA